MAVVLFAQHPALLARDTDRTATFLQEPGIVDDQPSTLGGSPFLASPIGICGAASACRPLGFCQEMVQCPSAARWHPSVLIARPSATRSCATSGTQAVQYPRRPACRPCAPSLLSGAPSSYRSVELHLSIPRWEDERIILRHLCHSQISTDSDHQTSKKFSALPVGQRRCSCYAFRASGLERSRPAR